LNRRSKILPFSLFLLPSPTVSVHIACPFPFSFIPILLEDPGRRTEPDTKRSAEPSRVPTLFTEGLLSFPIPLESLSSRTHPRVPSCYSTIGSPLLCAIDPRIASRILRLSLASAPVLTPDLPPKAKARSHMRPSLRINLSCLFALPTRSRCLSASRTQRPRPRRDCVSSASVERWNAIRWACKKSSTSNPCFTSFCVQETTPGNSAWRPDLVCNQTRLPMSLASINARFGGSEGSMELEQKESGRSIDPTKDGNGFTPLKHGAAIRGGATSPLYATTHPHPPRPERRLAPTYRPGLTYRRVTLSMTWYVCDLYFTLAWASRPGYRCAGRPRRRYGPLWPARRGAFACLTS
jgi:hypothetical protein